MTITRHRPTIQNHTGQGEASDSVKILDEEGNEVDMAKVNQEIDTIIKTEKGSE